MPPAKLSEYGSIPVANTVTDEAAATDPNISWVQAHQVRGDYMFASVSETPDEKFAGTGFAPAETLPSSFSPKFRDVPFGLLFLAHLAVMGWLGSKSGTWHGLLSDHLNPSIGAQDMVYIIGGSLVISFLVNLGLGIVTARFPEFAISTCLIASILNSIVISVVLVLTVPSILTFLLCFLIIMTSGWYVRTIQWFIPFSAATLKLGLKGLTANWGTYVVSILLAGAGVAFSVFWVYVANGIGCIGRVERVIDYEYDPVSDGNYHYKRRIDGKIFLLFPMLISLFWTITVLMNISQTTVAGVIGTYAFDKPSASSCCSRGVTQSLCRSLTNSFGSICFGSLLNAILSALRVLAELARESAIEDGRSSNDDECACCLACVFCCVQCILSCIEDLVQYFNQWAFIFVGVYGCGFLESGELVLNLFEERGCTAILSDSLARYVLVAMVIFSVALCGIFGALLAAFKVVSFSVWATVGISAFVGFIISAIMVNKIQGAVKAIIVCYVDHPSQMHKCHPADTEAMASAIALVFPEATHFNVCHSVVV